MRLPVKLDGGRLLCVELEGENLTAQLELDGCTIAACMLRLAWQADPYFALHLTGSLDTETQAVRQHLPGIDLKAL
jgi:hypothetical protein